MTPGSIRAVRCDGPGSVALTTVPRSTGDGVRIRVRAAGICGSDIAAVDGGAVAVTLGHELAGVTDDGRAVTVVPHVPCGTCGECARGLEHRCPQALARFVGLSEIDGGMAEELVVPASRVRVLPPGVEPEAGALVEPLAVGMHGVARVATPEGEPLLVIGAGTIGLCAAVCALDQGVDVTLLARHPHQQRAAERLGIPVVTTVPSSAYRSIVDAVGTKGALADAITAARPGARIVSFGKGGWDAELNEIGLVKEVTVAAAILYTLDEFDAAIALIARRPEIAAAIVTHRLPLDDVEQAFTVARDRAGGQAIKVQLRP